jgi:hypothetical protein
MYEEVAAQLSEHQEPFHISNGFPKIWEAVKWKLIVQANVAFLYIYDEALAVELELSKPEVPKFIRRDENYKKVLTTGNKDV